MSLFVSFIVTTTVTLMNLGIGESQLLLKILTAWSTAWPIAFISLFFVRPVVEKTIHKYTVE